MSPSSPSIICDPDLNTLMAKTRRRLEIHPALLAPVRSRYLTIFSTSTPIFCSSNPIPAAALVDVEHRECSHEATLAAKGPKAQALRGANAMWFAPTCVEMHRTSGIHDEEMAGWQPSVLKWHFNGTWMSYLVGHPGIGPPRGWLLLLSTAGCPPCLSKPHWSTCLID